MDGFSKPLAMQRATEDLLWSCQHSIYICYTFVYYCLLSTSLQCTDVAPCSTHQQAKAIWDISE